MVCGCHKLIKVNYWNSIYIQMSLIDARDSYKEFGHSHWWELIEIFVPKFGIWFSSLFPEWELIPTGIPTGGNWLKYLIPNLGFYSPAYSHSGNWFPQEFPLVGIDWNICSQIKGTFKSQLHVQIHFVLCNPSPNPRSLQILIQVQIQIHSAYAFELNV